MSKKKITLEAEVEMPDGYEETGELREPHVGEPHLGWLGTLCCVKGIVSGQRIILRKIAPEIPTLYVNVYPNGFDKFHGDSSIAKRTAGSD